MKTVMLFGTFDIIHPGHIQFFRQARTFGDKVICVVARDKTAEKIKRNLRNSEKERLENVKKLGILDEVILGNEEDPYLILEKYKPDVICLGYDQVSFTDKLQDELMTRDISAKVVRLNPYKEEKYKSSKL